MVVFFFSAKSLFLSVLTLSRSRLAPELGWVHGLIWAWWWARIGAPMVGLMVDRLMVDLIKV